MYARITILSLKKGTTAEAIRIFSDSILPASRTQEGYKGSYALADWQADKGITLTFWESEQAALASEENRYYQEQLVKEMHLFAAPPVREGYEVAVEHR